MKNIKACLLTGNLKIVSVYSCLLSVQINEKIVEKLKDMKGWRITVERRKRKSKKKNELDCLM